MVKQESDFNPDALNAPLWDPHGGDLSREVQEDLGYGDPSGEITEAAARYLMAQREKAAIGAIVTQVEKEHRRMAPVDEKGFIDTRSLESGHFIPEWGPVLGKPLPDAQEPEISLVDAPLEFKSRYGLAAMRFYAAREFAERDNIYKLALEQGSVDQQRNMRDKRSRWLEWSRQNNLVKKEK